MSTIEAILALSVILDDPYDCLYRHDLNGDPLLISSSSSILTPEEAFAVTRELIWNKLSGGSMISNDLLVLYCVRFCFFVNRSRHHFQLQAVDLSLHESDSPTQNVLELRQQVMEHILTQLKQHNLFFDIRMVASKSLWLNQPTCCWVERMAPSFGASWTKILSDQVPLNPHCFLVSSQHIQMIVCS